MPELDILYIVCHIAVMPKTMWRHRITVAGQLSLPADVRRRWATSTVVLEDEGDHLVVRPVPDDPIAAARGAFAGRGRGLTSSRLKALARSDELGSERDP
jgi:bifunctional DNA-binding transcriptional regulator/antitoxin component of YhaV-PrlF toxin-antitoxin module